MDKALERELQLDAILAAYLEANEEGQAPDRKQLLLKHPQFALELNAFFADCSQLEHLAQPLQAVARAAQMERPRPGQAAMADTPRPASLFDKPQGSVDSSQVAAAPRRELPSGATPQDPLTVDHISHGEDNAKPSTAPAGLPEVPGYEILGVLGRGGMGIVYKARHLKLKRVVALKMILEGAHAGSDQLMRFRAEAEAVARLHHPNIVQIYEINEIDGLPCFALEFCAGGSLAQMLKKKLMPPRAAAGLLEDLAVAMEHAHSLQVIHRDLKPANILLQGVPVKAGNISGFVAKITDFGLARQLDVEGLTQSGVIVGTPPYMAPEQFEGKSRELGPAVDIYALGAILYELLTGRPPFQGQTTLDIAMKVLRDAPVPPSRGQPKVPRDLEKICLKCLEKDRRRRYASAGELAADLGRFLRGEPVEARATHWVERAVMWSRRYPARATALALGVLLTVVVGVGSAMTGLWLRADEAHQEAAMARDKLDVKNVELENTNEKLKEKSEKLKEESEKVAELYAKLDRISYDDKIGLGWKQLELGNTLAAKISLGDCEPKHRNLEWYQLKYRLEPTVVSMVGHNAAVSEITISPDKLRLASLGKDGIAFLWDAGSGKKIAALGSDKAKIKHLAFSPDSRLLASAVADATVTLCDARTGENIATLRGHRAAVQKLDFAPDGKRLASAGADGVKLWDTKTHEKALDLEGRPRQASRVAFSPDGQWLACAGNDRTIRLWNTATGAETAALVHNEVITVLAWHKDSKLVASTCADLKFEIKLWEVPTGKEVAIAEGNTAPTTHLAFSPNGKQLAASCEDKKVRLWEATSGKRMHTLQEFADKVTSFAYTPDSAQLATAGRDGIVQLWDAQRGTRISTVAKEKTGVNCVTFSLDGGWLAWSGSDKLINLLDRNQSKGVATLQGDQREVRQVAYSRDGRRLASATEKAVELWDAVTGAKVAPLGMHERIVTHVEFSLDSRRLASASDDMTIKLWDALTGKELATLNKHRGKVTCAAFSPDQQLLASASWDNTIMLWNARSGAYVDTLKGHTDKVRHIAFNPDGQMLASAGEDKTIILWDVASRRKLKTLPGHSREVTRVAVSADGHMLASASADKTIKLWDLRSQKEIATLAGHKGQVLQVAFNPKKSWQLASAGLDNDVKVWDVRDPKKEAFILMGHTNAVLSLTFSPDGERLVSAGRDGAVMLWDTLTYREVASLTPFDKKEVLHVAFCPDGQQLATAGADGAVRLWYGKRE